MDARVRIPIKVIVDTPFDELLDYDTVVVIVTDPYSYLISVMSVHLSIPLILRRS